MRTIELINSPSQLNELSKNNYESVNNLTVRKHMKIEYGI
jgi:hypothetical protein